MVLSKKSWHFWIYNQFFSRDLKNFCPYFWKTMISCVIFLPCAFICAPFWIVCLAIKDDKPRIANDFGAGFGLWMVSGLLVCMIGMFFSDNKAVEGIGMLGWCLGGLMLLILIGLFIEDNVKYRDTFVGKYTKAKREKYCPKIEWEEEEGKRRRASSKEIKG